MRIAVIGLKNIKFDDWRIECVMGLSLELGRRAT
jgi:hypothetical protein